MPDQRHIEKHDLFERKCLLRMVEMGCYIYPPASYHHVWDVRAVSRIQKDNSPTAIKHRTAPDRLVSFGAFSFYVDFKTFQDGNNANVAIELLPFLVHRIDYWAGVKVLYCVIGEDGREFGFWVDPQIDDKVNSIHVPRNSRLPVDALDNLESKAHQFFPGAEIKDAPVSGSGDPFVIIPKEATESMPHWAELIKEIR